MSDKLKDLFELPEERLATTDESGKRVFLHPADVRGFFHQYRSWVHLVLVVILLALPWININGHPAILLDIVDRKFAILGLTFWAHDAPMLFFVLASTAFSVALVTAVWGRVWCGWACPETVFTESVYRKIERWLEGSATARRKLDVSPWNFRKIRIKSTKWFLYWIVSMVITHSVIAYFVGAERLASYVGGPISAHPEVFWFAFFLTIVLMIAFGWFREQFCIIVCPYGRMQSFLLDDNSLVVSYDEKRGEPRRAKDVPVDEQGDCVSCYRCVQVCPTGIDIRRGLQMECIACTACIDACDEVMTKVKKPLGLIKYETYDRKPIRYFRLRTIIYGSILAILLSGLTFLLVTREQVDLKVLRAKDTPYQVVNDAVINHFKLSVANNHFETVQVRLDTSEAELITHIKEFDVGAGKKKDIQFFVRFPKRLLDQGSARIPIHVKIEHPVEGPRDFVKEAKLVGPY